MKEGSWGGVVDVSVGGDWWKKKPMGRDPADDDVRWKEGRVCKDSRADGWSGTGTAGFAIIWLT